MPTSVYEKRSLTLEETAADLKDYVDVAVEAGTEELARMVAKGFAGVDREFAEVRQQFREVNERFDGIDKRFDGIDDRLEGMDKRFDGMDVRFDRLENLIIERTK
jgi:phage shock protein A